LRYCSLSNSVVPRVLFLKGVFGGLREECIYKLTLVSTPKRGGTIGCTRTSLPSRGLREEIPHRRHQCSDLKSVEMTSLELITTSEILSALELGCSITVLLLKFVLKELREKDVYK